jgi:hypothetical protein
MRFGDDLAKRLVRLVKSFLRMNSLIKTFKPVRDQPRQSAVDLENLAVEWIRCIWMWRKK